MSSLREQLSAAAAAVPERDWDSPAAVATRGRQRTRHRRAATTGVTLAAVVALVLGVLGVQASNRAQPVRPSPTVDPSPTPRTVGCLTVDGGPGPGRTAGQIVITGDQLLRVDLSSGQAFAESSCGGGAAHVLPVAHAQVTQKGDYVTIIDSNGHATDIGNGSHLTQAYLTPDGGFLVSQDNFPRGPQATLQRYDAYGRAVGKKLVVPETDVWGIVGVLDTGIVAFTEGGTDAPGGGLWLVETSTGRPLQVLDRTTDWADTVAGHLAAWRTKTLAEGVVQAGDGKIPLSCRSTCGPLVVYDSRTGQRRQYPSTTPTGRLYTTAAFSPDGTLLALGTADDPGSDEGATVAVLDLASGTSTLLPGIPSVGRRMGPWLTWLPTGELVIASSTSTRAQLLTWHPGDRTARTAVTLAGDPADVTVTALTPGQTAWP